MERVASIRFFGSLNDFLPVKKRDSILPHSVTGSQAVKDAVEAIGVPHTEVEAILANGNLVNFSYLLQPGDDLSVYSKDHKLHFPKPIPLRKPLPTPLAFVLDVHLGKLARALRMLGFDIKYQNDYTDAEIVRIALAESRVVLTRDVGLLKLKELTWGYWLRSQHFEEQLQEVVRYFNLRSQWHPFSRCIACNGTINEVPKASVWAQLPPKTRLYFEQFYHCSCCNRTYWKDSHYDRMQQFVQWLRTL